MTIDDEIVGDVLAAVHVGTRLDAQARSGLHVLAQDVARGDLRDVEVVDERWACVPFPAPGGPSSTSRIGPYFRKPS